MARRSKAGDAITTALAILVLLVIAAVTCFAVLIPVIWIVAELWRFTAKKQRGGFRLLDDEYRDGLRVMDDLMSARASLESIEEEAARHGCKARMDGRWDERNAAARELNIRRDDAEIELSIAQAGFEEAMDGPRLRFEAWRKPQAIAWAGRLAMVAYLGLALAFPDQAKALLLALQETSDLDSAMELAFGFLPAALCGGLAFGVGALVGFGITSSAEPPDAYELMRERLERLGADHTDSAGIDLHGESDQLPSEASSEDYEALAQRLLVDAAARSLKYVAITDGRVTDAERESALGLLRTGLSEWPDMLERAVRQFTIDPAGEAETAQSCSAIRTADLEFRKALVGMCMHVGTMGSGSREGERVGHVASWLGLSDRDIDDLLKSFRSENDPS